VQNLESRADVDYKGLCQDEACLAYGELAFDGQNRPVVPYRYCGDEFADYAPTCMRYDAGADQYETLTSVIDQYWNYYTLNNFMRQRIGFDPEAVAERVYTRYFQKLEDANLNYTLWRGILSSEFGVPSEFFQSRDGFGAYTTAVGAAYELLTRVVATPEPGCHLRTQTADGFVYNPWTPVSGDPNDCDTGGNVLKLDAFDGRGLRTRYSLGPDYSFWFMTRAGYFQDKSLALQVLTDPGARVIGQDTLVDIRRFQVSFYTTFQQPVQEVLRGVIGEDSRPFAARWTGGELVFPTANDQMSGGTAMTGDTVRPSLSFALQIYTMAFGMAYLPRTFDYSFIDRGRLFVRGAAESVELATPLGPAPVVEFFDDASGLVYVAPSYPDAQGRETGVSAQVLLRAQALKDAGETTLLSAWMANVNVLRRLTYVMGFGGDDAAYL
jgi:hypothetical protein